MVIQQVQRYWARMRRKCKTTRPLKWSNSGGRNTDKETIGPQRKGSGRERTTKNSGTRTCGDYSKNKKRGI
jgi:hypothetical protein